MNLNKIGFAVGLLAFALAVPLAITANLLTPKVQEWYGTTSYNRAKRRLALLQKRLADADWVCSPAEWKVLQFLSVLLVALNLGVSTTITLLLVIMMGLAHEMIAKDIGKHDLVFFVCTGALIGIFIYAAGIWGMMGLGRFERMHSLKGRRRVEQEIARLRVITASDR